MPVEIKAPPFAESISQAQIGEWVKREGDYVERDDVVVELETDKAALEVVAPVSGTIVKTLKSVGDPVLAGEALAEMEEGGAPPKSSEAKETKDSKEGKEAKEEPSKETKRATTGKDREPHVMPAARRAMSERGMDSRDVEGSGPGGRILKEDVERARGKVGQWPASGDGREREIVPMSLIRKRIAARLVEAQQAAALLTTFNEIDMSSVIEMRKAFQESFQAQHSIKLGFMSFFVKAAVDALQRFPAVNAQIEEESIVYHNYQDVGVAVGGGKGLVVPVIRNAERLSFAAVEKTIADFASRAAENKIRPEELEGGTFTISNGGIYGSMLSTPIVNPPQSAILGLHAIQERAVVRDGQIVARPMMNVALTYDHRIIDGREAVRFLLRVKEAIESPARMFLEV